MRVYILHNDLHERPLAYIEDVFVQAPFRGQGNGSRILQAAIEEAKKQGCYKIIANSRFSREKVHKFYQQQGFSEYGKEFRIDLGHDTQEKTQ